MKIHEYQAKAILARHGVPVPRGEVTSDAAEAGEIAKRLGGAVVVVKAQIHAGGRGKGGGVKLAKSPARGRPARARHDRHDPHHAPDRARRACRRAGADRRGSADDARAVSEHRARSRGRQAGDHGQRGRRHGHRRGRREDAGEDRPRLRRAGGRHRAVRGATARLRHRPRRGAGEQVRQGRVRALRRVPRDRRVARSRSIRWSSPQRATCSRSTRR